MCTVTFIPQPNGFVFTSNRDEAPERDTVPPQLYMEDSVSLLFPKDVVAGGTWIGVSSQKRLVCLLNGGFVAHQRRDKYRMSRGVVVKDLLKTKNVLKAVTAYDLDHIEPFTVVIVDWGKHLVLFELVWDGSTKHVTQKPLQPIIWSSSLLYTPVVKKEREQWFASFFEQSIIDKNSVLSFHKSAGNGDVENNLVMKRSYVATKSITQVTFDANILQMRYEDLQNETVTLHSI